MVDNLVNINFMFRFGNLSKNELFRENDVAYISTSKDFEVCSITNAVTHFKQLSYCLLLNISVRNFSISSDYEPIY